MKSLCLCLIGTNSQGSLMFKKKDSRPNLSFGLPSLLWLDRTIVQCDNPPCLIPLPLRGKHISWCIWGLP